MVRVAVLALVASVLLLGTPAWGQSVEEIERLIAELGDEDADVRFYGACRLAQAGRKAAPAVPALVAALSDEDPNVRGEAVWALALVGPKAPPVVRAVTEALSDEDGGVRAKAGWALDRIGREAASAVPALTAALSNDANAAVRTSAAHALGSVGPQAARAVPALAAALSDEDSSVRVGAAYALRVIGPGATPAVPALIEALSGEDSDSAAYALRVMGLLAVPDLAAAASHGDRVVNMRVGTILGEIGTGLKAKGTLLLWVVPRAFWKEILGLLLLLTAWFALMGRFPRHRPIATLAHVALMGVTTVVPAALSGFAVNHAITREWAQGFLPDAVTLAPFPLAAVLSTALVCALPAVWVCQRKKLAE